MSIVMEFYSCVKLTAFLPDAEGKSGNFRQEIDLAGYDPSLVSKALTLVLAIRQPHRLEIAVNDHPLCAVGVHEGQTPSDRDNLTALQETASDLESVQKLTGIYFAFPEQVSNLDRVWLRCARLMLEGKATYVPRTVFTGRANGGASSIDVPQDGQRKAVVLDTPSSTLEIFGQRIPLPGVRFYHPAAEVMGARASRRDVDAGVALPREFTMRATGNGFFMAYMPSVYREETVTATNWKLTGVEELPAIEAKTAWA